MNIYITSALSVAGLGLEIFSVEQWTLIVGLAGPAAVVFFVGSGDIHFKRDEEAVVVLVRGEEVSAVKVND